MSRRTFTALALLATLLVAGVLSFYASESPDGLEHVAETTGFAAAETDHATEASPFADYGFTLVDSDRLSVAVAGILGCAVVLLLMLGLARLVRRPSVDAEA
ncbi:PDGLE domain-containing protein [Nocardioides limicola]|uniref:PDGLE domain-containing protein n=1 Tax=Nocardioides limicola TaxID=2803368 RepID=UPI00193C1030|nr:PDGLE domain-containing protein [Nocardioides sp. DJM-14]